MIEEILINISLFLHWKYCVKTLLKVLIILDINFLPNYLNYSYQIIVIWNIYVICTYFLHPNKIIGVYLQIFDSVIRDWLEPPNPLRAPSQSEEQWSREGERARWCSYFRWCHIALPLFVLKVVSLIPYWRWFDYTFTHSLVMGSPHGPWFNPFASMIAATFC